MSVKESLDIINDNNLADESPLKDNQFQFTGLRKQSSSIQIFESFDQDNVQIIKQQINLNAQQQQDGKNQKESYQIDYNNQIIKVKKRYNSSQELNLMKGSSFLVNHILNNKKVQSDSSNCQSFGKIPLTKNHTDQRKLEVTKQNEIQDQNLQFFKKEHSNSQNKYKNNIIINESCPKKLKSQQKLYKESPVRIISLSNQSIKSSQSSAHFVDLNKSFNDSQLLEQDKEICYEGTELPAKRNFNQSNQNQVIQEQQAQEEANQLDQKINIHDEFNFQPIIDSYQNFQRNVTFQGEVSPNAKQDKIEKTYFEDSITIKQAEFILEQMNDQNEQDNTSKGQIQAQNFLKIKKNQDQQNQNAHSTSKIMRQSKSFFSNYISKCHSANQYHVFSKIQGGFNKLSASSSLAEESNLIQNQNSLKDAHSTSLEQNSQTYQFILQLKQINKQIRQISEKLLKNNQQIDDQNILQELFNQSKLAETLCRQLFAESKTSNITQREKDEVNQQQTQIKQLNEKIEDLEKRLKAQDIFISMIIHDMRSPTMAIIGITENINQYFQDEQKRAQKLNKMLFNSELESIKVIQKGIELQNLSQQSLIQEIQAINQILNNSFNEQRRVNTFSDVDQQQRVLSGHSNRNVQSSQLQKKRNLQKNRSEISQEANLGRKDMSSLIQSDDKISASFQSSSSQDDYPETFNNRLKKPKFSSNKQKNSPKNLEQASGPQQIVQINGLEEIKEDSNESKLEKIFKKQRVTILEQINNQQSIQQIDERSNENSGDSNKSSNRISSSKQAEIISNQSQNQKVENVLDNQIEQKLSKNTIKINSSQEKNNLKNFSFAKEIKINNNLKPIEDQIIENQPIVENNAQQDIDFDEHFNFQEDDFDEFANTKITKPSQRFQRDFECNTNNLKSIMDTSHQNSRKMLEYIQIKMQKYAKNELTGKINENPDYASLYELISLSQHRVVILQKQYIFTGAMSIIPEDQQPNQQISQKFQNNLQQKSFTINNSFNKEENQQDIFQDRKYSQNFSHQVKPFNQINLNQEQFPLSEKIQRKQKLSSQIPNIINNQSPSQQSESQINQEEIKQNFFSQPNFQQPQIESDQINSNVQNQINPGSNPFQEFIKPQLTFQISRSGPFFKQLNNSHISFNQNVNSEVKPSISSRLIAENQQQKYSQSSVSGDYPIKLILQNKLQDQSQQLSVKSPIHQFESNNILKQEGPNQRISQNFNQKYALQTPLSSNSRNNILQFDPESRASLISMAHNAQLLIQLQNNSQLESQLALQELSKRKESITSYFQSKDVAISIVKLTAGLSFQAKMLLNLVNDLLDYAKFENGKFVFLNERFDLAQLIKVNSFQTVECQAQEKKISIQYSALLELAEGPQIGIYDFSSINSTIFFEETNRDLKKKRQKIVEKLFLKRMIGDERRYLQILLNFLTNAIKFSNKKGTINVCLKIFQIQLQTDLKCDSEQGIHDKKSENSDLEVEQDKDKLSQVLKSIAQIGDSSQNFSNISKLELNKISIGNEDDNNGFSHRKFLNSLKVNLKSERLEMIHEKIEQAISEGDEEKEKLNKQNQSMQERMVRIDKINAKIQEENLSKQEDQSKYINAFVHFKIEISDSGIGIKEENLDKLFLQFNKLDEQSKMNRQGTGLGLTISRNMVRQIGGDITVKSEFGKGTTFSILLCAKSKVLRQDLKTFINKDQDIDNSTPLDNADSNSRPINRNNNNKSEIDINLISLQSSKSLKIKLNHQKNLKTSQEKNIEKRSDQFLLEEQRQIVGQMDQNLNFSIQSSIKNEKEDDSIYLKHQKLKKETEILKALLKHSLQNNINNQMRLDGNSPKIEHHSLNILDVNSQNYFQSISKSLIPEGLNVLQKSLQNYDVSFREQKMSFGDRYSLDNDDNLNYLFNNQKLQQIPFQNFKEILSNKNCSNESNSSNNWVKSLQDQRQSILKSSKNQQFSQSSLQNQFENIKNLQNDGQQVNSFVESDQIPSGKNKNIFSQLSSQNLQSLDKQITPHSNSLNDQMVNFLEINKVKIPVSNAQMAQLLNSISMEEDGKIKQHQAEIKGQQLKQIEKIQKDKLIQQSLENSYNISPSMFNSHNDHQEEEQKKQLKTLIANDEPFQLMMMSSCLKKMKFQVYKAINGYEAFYKVRRFIENYDRVRSQLQQPGASCKHLSKEDLQLVKSTLQNFDVIILDLNMPIMNGYNACERICEIYNQFNNLPDFDELMLNNPEQQKQVDQIYKIFQDNEMGKYDDDSEDKSQFKIIRTPGSNSASSKSFNGMLKQVKNFQVIKTHINGILRSKPLMVACSAEVNDQVIKDAKAVGFDIVIGSPLTDTIIKNELITEIEKKRNIAKKLNLQSQIQPQILKAKTFNQIRINSMEKQNQKQQSSHQFKRDLISIIYEEQSV